MAGSSQGRTVAWLGVVVASCIVASGEVHGQEASGTLVDSLTDRLEVSQPSRELVSGPDDTRFSQAVDTHGGVMGAVARLAVALSRLTGLMGVQVALIELKRLEDDGDRIVRDAIASLFHDDRIDPLIVIRWKDIYESLEAALDACETAANVLGNVVVKNQ